MMRNIMNLRISSWREAIQDVQIESYYDLNLAFDRLSAQRKEQGKEDDHLSLKLLSKVCSMYLKTESLADPFGPMVSGPNGRTLIPEDLTEVELDALEDILTELDNHWLNARICDVLWVRRKRRELAIAAMNSYVCMSDEMTQLNNEAIEILQRALIIARAFDRTRWQSIVDKLVCRYLNDTTDTVADKLDLFLLFARFLKTLSQKEDVISRLYEYGEIAADNNDFTLARECWDHLRKYQRVQKRVDESHRLTHRIAESLMSEANLRTAESSSLIASDSLARAALAELKGLPRTYRREHDIDGVIDRLSQDLGKQRAEIIGSMGSITSEPINITDMVVQTRQRLDGKLLHDALFEYARMCYRTDVETTRQLARDLVRDHPLSYIIGRKTYSSDGRIVALSDPLDLNDPTSFGKVVEAETVRQFGVSLGFIAAGCILPGLEVIQARYYLSLGYCHRIVSQAILVPNERAEAWAKGIYHGFNGNVFEATHILLPQVEYLLRWLLQSAGYDTIVREIDGTEVQMSLERTIAHQAIKEMLNDALWFELNYYFLSPHGANLRNEMLHGLVSDEDMQTTLLYCFWHLCVRMVVLTLPDTE